MMAEDNRSSEPADNTLMHTRSCVGKVVRTIRNAVPGSKPGPGSKPEPGSKPGPGSKPEPASDSRRVPEHSTLGPGCSRTDRSRPVRNRFVRGDRTDRLQKFPEHRQR